MKNLLYIMLLVISVNLWSQSNSLICDSIIYMMIPQSPAYFGDLSLIENKLSTSVDNYTKSILSGNTVRYSLTIDCLGQVTVSGGETKYEPLRLELENCFNEFKWIPGKHKNQPENFQTIILVSHSYNKFNIRTNLKELKGNQITSIIMDEITGYPLADVRIETEYNGQSYYSNETGLVEYYAEPYDIVIVDHIYYQKFSFELPENVTSFSIKLTESTFKIETLDLTKYSPKKLPIDNFECIYEDYNEPESSNHIFLNNDPYEPTLATFNLGFGCLYNYIAENFILPELAYNEDYADTIQVKFLVTEKGEITNITFDKELKYGINDKFFRLFIESPLWQPATQARKNTKQWMQISIIIGRNKYWKKYYG